MRHHLPILLALTLAAGCKSPQRIAGPVWLPGGQAEALGLAGVGDPIASVLRHAGPVDVRRAGAPAGSRLAYYDKEARLRGGSSVIVGPGGRAELLWDADASSVVLFGDSVAVLGDPELEEPTVRLLQLVRVQLQLTPEDRVVLPGGALLRAEGGGPAGPFRLEDQGGGVLRLRNESKVLARVSYRDVVLEVAPGDVIDLPVLAAGTAPIERGGAPLRTRVGDLLIESTGRIEPTEVPGGVRVRAAEPGEVACGGVRVRLEAGQAAVFSGLGDAPAAGAQD